MRADRLGVNSADASASNQRYSHDSLTWIDLNDVGHIVDPQPPVRQVRIWIDLQFD
jgi:hypothetical protein